MSKKANIDEAKRKQEFLKAERRKKNCLQTVHPDLADIVQNPLINRSELSMRMYPDLAKEGEAITRATAVFFHKVVGDRKFESEELPKMHYILKEYVEDQIKGYAELKKKLDKIKV